MHLNVGFLGDRKVVSRLDQIMVRFKQETEESSCDQF